MDKNYLREKWLTNDLTPEEQDAFDAMEDSVFLKEIIKEGQRFKGQNPTKVLAFDKLEKSLKEKPNTTLNWSKVVLRIAAVFVVGLGLYSVFSTNQRSVFETQIAQTEKIELPDQSTVILNELSQIDFDAKNWDTERNIELDGEAYFKVAKGKRFDVNTKFGTVSVLGTQFDVLARDTIFSVICYEGLVEVSHNNITTQLSAGKAYRVIKDIPQTYNVAVIQPDWLQNMKVFENANIGDVIAALENHYKIKIRTENIDHSILFTGAFELDNLENALKATTQSLNLTYTINAKNEVTIRNAKE